ncbi:MAG: NADH-quinone oxidoreductase subunit [Frankiaceae bacterium]|jgi:NADH-quinone oxidoreductase subunit I|nr:NADH-quinone oxidoreductase subunit [Frankiaceae bacterium]
MAGGVGLVKGLAVTLKTMTRRSVTRQYPDVKPALPPRSRGVIALMEENCTVCMLCSRECPDWCIYIDSHKETVPPKEPGARARTRNMLDRFAIDFALCMYCGICIEVCPFDALFWSPEFEYSEYDIRELTHEKERLREWMYTVPAPPMLDPDGAPPAELVAAEKAEPKVYEAPSLGGAPVAAPAVAAAPAAAPAAPPVEAAPAAPAAAKPAREHAEIDKDDVGIDQAVFDAAVAGGMSERQARAKAKSAWMKAWKKQNAVAAADAAPPAQEAPAAAPSAEVAPEAAEAAPAAPPAAEPVDVGEPQIDQETYDAAIAAGESDRVARAKAKSAWVKKARKAAQGQ